MWHEHSRPDRDDYVKIKWRNIDEDQKHNFGKMGLYTEQSSSLTPYDFKSLMHYSSYSWTLNWMPTIVKKDGSEILPNRTPSELDILGAKKLFEKANKVYVSANELTISDISLLESGPSNIISFKPSNGIAHTNFRILSELSAENPSDSNAISEGTTFEDSIFLPFLDAGETYKIILTPCTMKEVAVSQEVCGKEFEYSFSVNSDEINKELIQELHLLENTRQALVASAITSLENFIEEVMVCYVIQEDEDYQELNANIGYVTEFLLTIFKENNIVLSQSIIDSILQFGLYRVNDPNQEFTSSNLSLTLRLPKWGKKSPKPQPRPIKKPKVPLKKTGPKKPPTKKELLIRHGKSVVVVTAVVGAFKVFVWDEYFSSNTPYGAAEEECSVLADARAKLEKKIIEIGHDLREIDKKITSFSE
ncbi:MAG: M12 family metallopeptidase [Oligoflexales bacterium]